MYHANKMLTSNLQKSTSSSGSAARVISAQVEAARRLVTESGGMGKGFVGLLKKLF